QGGLQQRLVLEPAGDLVGLAVEDVPGRQLRARVLRREERVAVEAERGVGLEHAGQHLRHLLGPAGLLGGPPGGRALLPGPAGAALSWAGPRAFSWAERSWSREALTCTTAAAEPRASASSSTSTVALSAATRGERPAQRTSRPRGPTGRARMGSRRRKRPRSSARSRALA